MSNTNGPNGAILNANQSDLSKVGTGVIDSFLRIQADGSEFGYNTDAKGQVDDDKGGQFTHSILLSSLDTATKPGYYTFLLDINQNKTTPGKLISLDDIQLYYATAGDISTNPTPSGSGATKVFDFQTATSAVCDSPGVCTTVAPRNEILLNYANNNGSGNGLDMFLFVPVGVFAGVPAADFVYLYSKFGGLGGDFASNDGFEEWAEINALGQQGVPEPRFVGILLAALLGMGLCGRRFAKEA